MMTNFILFIYDALQKYVASSSSRKLSPTKGLIPKGILVPHHIFNKKGALIKK